MFILFVLSHISLHATAFGGTATIVGQRCDVDDLCHFDAASVDSSDCGFPSRTRTFYVSFHFAQAQIVGYLTAIFRSHLSGVRSVFLRSSETHFSGRRPRNHLTGIVCQRNNHVVERGKYARSSHWFNFYNSFFGWF